MCANELYDLYIAKEKDLDNRSKLNFIKCIEEFYMKSTIDSYILNELKKKHISYIEDVLYCVLEKKGLYVIKK